MPLKFSKQSLNILFLAFLMALLTLLATIHVYSASTGNHTPTNGVTVKVSGATDNSMSNGSITITAKGSAGIFGWGASAKTTTIVVKNESGGKANISFTITKENVNSLVADKGTLLDTGYTMTMDAGAEVKFTLTTGANDTENKVIFSNFQCLPVAENAKATVTFDSTKGSVTMGGSTVGDGGSVTVTAGTIEATAIPVNGCSFIGWINKDTREILSNSANATLNVPQNMNIEAVFVTTVSDIAYFKVGNYLYSGLTTAIESGKATVVVLANNATLPSGNYTIPSGMTLLIPYDTAGNVIANDMEKNVLTSNDSKTKYRELTMESGANITVASGGALCVGSRAYYLLTGQAGPYGAINMKQGSSISIASGGTLYAWGYIYGSGTVTVYGTVYEILTVMDYPGSATDANGIYDNGAFPMRAYTVRGVEVPMTYYSGAKGYAFYCVYALSSNHTGHVLFVGSTSDQSAVFQLGQGSTLTKSYSAGTQYLVFNGDSAINSMSVQISIKNVKTANTSGIPIPSGYDIQLQSGTTILKENILMMEGSRLSIAQGATVDANGKNIYIFADADDPGAVLATDVHGVMYTNKNSNAVIDVNGTLKASGGFYTTKSKADIISSGGTGVIQVTGSSGSNSLNFRGAATNKPASCEIVSAKLKNADGEYTETSAGTYNYGHGKWFKGDHTVTDTVVAPTCTTEGYTSHTCLCGYSVNDNTVPIDPEAHDYSGSGTVIQPSCTEPGSETKTCPRCEKQKVIEIPAVGHDYKEEEWKVDDDNKWHWHICNLCDQEVDKAEHFDEDTDLKCDACGAGVACEHPDKETKEENVVEATCTVGGSYELVTYCTVCKEKTKTEKRTTPTVAHSLTKTEAVEATCSKPGNIAYWTCTVCGKYFNNSAGTSSHEIQENKWVTTVPHTPGDEATCTTAQICTVCGATVVEALDHDYSEQFTTDQEATCTEAGSKSRHCSRCDSTTEVTEIPAIQHDWEVSYSVNDDETECTASGVCRNNPEHTVSATVEIKATVKDAATCTEDGTTTYTADFTGYGWAETQSTDVTVEKLGHIDAKNPETGWADHKCDRCSEILSEECSDGESDDDYLCDVCGVNLCKHETVEKHNCVQCEKKLTECDDGEVEDFICEICGADMCPHDAGTKPIEAKAPTCVDDGYKAHYECITCEHKFSDEYAKVPVTMEELKDPKTGEHTPGDDDGDCMTAILCTVCKAETTPGNTKHTPGEDDGDCTTAVKCVNCDKNAIEAKEHVEDVAVKENEVPATCAKEGSYDNVVYCVDCKTELDRKTITVPATGEHNYVLKWNETSKWNECGCGQKEEGSEQSREFTFVFKGYDDASDIELEGTYQYGSTVDVPMLVLGFETKFFHLEGNWMIDGRTIEQGSTFDWELIRQSLIESSDDTITIPGTYRVAVKPETIQMSATYGDSSDSDVFLTLSLFIMVDPELITVDVTWPENFQIKGGPVSDDLPGLYHYSLPLTAKQLENNDAFVTVYLSENGMQRYSNKIELAWLNYSNNIDFTQVSQVTGQLLNATMDYGKAIQAVCATTDTELDEQTQNRINTVLTQLIENPPKTITSEEYTVSESAFNSVVSLKNAYGVFNQTAANFGLAYSFALNLPDNAELTRAGILLTEKGQVMNGAFTLIDGDKQQKTNEALGANFGRYYAYDHEALDREGYRLVEIKNVPAAELSVKFVTVYVEYTVEGETYFEYSQSIEYGVMTYLNNTMAAAVKGGTYDEKAKKELYLYKSAFDIANSVIAAPESSN